MALSDFVQNWEAGGAAARSDKARKSLASYMQGDQSALAGAYANDPQAAMQAQQFTGSQKQSADQEFVKLSNVYAQSKDPATYAGWRQAGIAAGRLPPETPSALTDPADVAGSLKTAQAWAGGNQAEQFTLAPGSTRYDASGRVIAEQPFAPEKPDFQLYDGADGPAWLPKPTGAPQGAPTRPFSGMGTPGQPPVASGPALDPTQDFPRLASAVPGVQNTSLFRDPKNNSRVGGVSNSQHMKGTAGDFVVPQAQRQQFMQQARSMGYEAIDEGDHVHVELPPGRTAANRFGAGQGLNAIPVAGVRPKPKADGAPSGYTWGPDGRTLVAIPGGPADRKNNPTAADQAKGEMQQRKEVTDLVKNDRLILGMYDNVRSAASTPTAAGDLSMIFAYMKMLDPGSVVREAEFANAQNATGVPDRIRNQYNQVMRGNRLNPDQRQDFIRQAQQIANTASNRITRIARDYQGIAEQYGYDPTRATGLADFRGVTSSARAPTGQQSGGYQTGQVIEAGGKRYRVTGGDPSDPDVEEIQ